ncbi:MAG: peptidase domain-containing ABC transporter [Bacteroidota bacterium]
MKKSVRIKQRDITDCGAACLASVAAFFELKLPVSIIRQYASTDKRGTNVLGLLEAAQQLGFEAKAAKGAMKNLPHIPVPSIAHIIAPEGLHHYVVIYKVTDKYILIMDPADGLMHKKGIADFEKEWTGVIVLLLPSENFKKGNETISVVSRFWQLIKPHGNVMFAAFIGAIVFTILGLSTSIYMQKLIDYVLVDGNTRLLNTLSVVMILILIFQIFIGNIKTIFALKTGQHIDARLILGYYKHLLQLPQRFFDTMRVGEIISRINDAVKIRVFINDVLINMIVNGFIVLFSIALMFLYYWKLALIMLLIIPFYLVIYFISNKINKNYQRKLMESGAELETQLVESVNAAGTIKRFGIEEYENIRIEDKFIKLLRIVYRSSVNSLYLNTSSDFVTRLFTIIILWAGSYFVISRELSPGELLSFYALIGYFTGPATSLIYANKSIQDAIIAADRLFEIIDLETEVESNAQTFSLTAELLGDIQFENVTFRYGSRKEIFTNLNLIIKKGTSTAIIGESGSGKSTLLSLLQNLYPLKEGKITIGDYNITQVTKFSLRKIVAVVPQHIDLFVGTIIENIALGELEPNLKRILELSKMLGINEFIEQMPEGYNSILNEQGINLSGGQRQRLAIARALYREPEILILDEATSSLDPIAEYKVQETLEWFKRQGKTIVIIAHRLKTIQNCDTIIAIQDGKVIEQGSHFELIQNDAYYKAMLSNSNI